MLNLICHIEIQDKDTQKSVSFDYVNKIEVKTSTRNLTDTATIIIPRKVAWKEKPITDFIKRNDRINIQAGYAEYGIQTLFQGVITEAKNSIPLEITCANEMQLFKTITVPAEVIAKFDFKQYVEKYGKIQVEQPAGLSFGSMTIAETMTLAEAIDRIQQVFPYLKCWFQDGKMYVITAVKEKAVLKPVMLETGRNIINDSLQYTRSEDIKIGIKAVSILNNNSKLEAYAPAKAFKPAKSGKTIASGYNQRQFYAPGCKTQAELQAFADKTAATFSEDKLTGDITLFGVPFVRKSDNIIIRDSERKEIDGKRYSVEAVDYTFGTGGFRQKITLGGRLSE